MVLKIILSERNDLARNDSVRNDSVRNDSVRSFSDKQLK